MKELSLEKFTPKEAPVKIVGQSMTIGGWVEKYWESPMDGVNDLYQLGMGMLKMEISGYEYEIQNPFAPSFNLGELRDVFQSLKRVSEQEPETALAMAINWLDSSRFSDEHLGRLELFGFIAHEAARMEKETAGMVLSILKSRSEKDRNPDYVKYAIKEIEQF